MTNRFGRFVANFTLLLVACAASHAQNSAVVATRQADWQKINPVTQLTVSTFATPPATDWPWVRYNMPVTADPKEITAEVLSMRTHGIAGLEVGQGGFPNTEQLKAILIAANKVGVKVSLSHGPTQNPVGYSIDDDHARKTLYFGKTVVDGGQTVDGALPGPPPLSTQVPPGVIRPTSTRATLVAVLAYRCSPGACAAKGPLQLERGSAIDLTETVTGKNSSGVKGGTTAGNLHWVAPVAPAGTQWAVVALWTRNILAQPDPFSKEGLDQLITSMETAFTPEIKTLLRANAGDLFYDSHSSDRGVPDELWTNNMAAAFQAETHYSAVPYLPVLFRDDFNFTDGTADKFRDDYWLVRENLWLETQIKPLEQWVRKYNLRLRVQVEGERNIKIPAQNEVRAATAVDRPEHESLFTADEVDNYLTMASANHMTGNTWYSTECCAARTDAYAQTYQDTTIRMHKSFAGGINKLVYHTYPYRDGENQKWPGYNNFGQAGFSNQWGMREPYWQEDARVYNSYYARNQQVLTQGVAKTDVAVFLLNYLYPETFTNPGGFRIWPDLKLQEAGFTRDYLDPTLLGSAMAKITGGRLAAEGPAYRALIIDSEQNPPTDPVKTSMPVDAAQRILSFAKAGLPVIIVGKEPDRVPGNDTAGDTTLKAVIAALLMQPSVSRVAHESDVPEKLLSLGIRPAAQPQKPGPLLSVRRYDPATKTDYYFLYNQGAVSPKGEPELLFEPALGEPISTKVILEGTGRPFLLNAWTGKITPIPVFSEKDGRVTVQVALSRDNATLIALAPAARFGATAGPHVTGTTADRIVTRNGSLMMQVSKAGDYSATLMNGRTVNVSLAKIPEPIDLTHAKWHVAVEDWKPANPYDSTRGERASETTKNKLDLDLDELKPWPSIPQLQHVSGIGTYRTEFDLPTDWKPGTGAMLRLGEVFDSFALTINGVQVPVDQLSAETDAGPYLKAGKNTIVVRVATTLNNRLSELEPLVKKRGIVQQYGLIGPVVLTPYHVVPVQP